MADIEKIATDRYRICSHEQLLTVSARDLIDLVDWYFSHLSEVQAEAKGKSVCDHCHKEVDTVYDLTPAALGDFTTMHVCEDCYEQVAHELEQDGYDLDLGQ